jgi:ParB family chromosome partitioning protein
MASINSRKESLRALFNPSVEIPQKEKENESSEQSENESEKVRSTSSAVRTMGLNLEKLSSEAERARLLREQLASGATIVELEPDLIERSFIADRFSGTDDLGDLVQSISEHGQQIPILVRPHPEKSDRYQMAFGHRRLRAVAELGLKVRAIVRELTDTELVIAQGKENNDRKDLSFIERAFFARHLEERGFERRIIIAALAIDKTEVARLLSVAHAVEPRLALAIGPAPKVGRTRWLGLVQLLSGAGAEVVTSRFLEDQSLHQLDSDTRFNRLFQGLAARTANASVSRTVWSDPAGRPLVRVEKGAAVTRLIISERLAPAFGDFLVAKLDELHGSFLAEMEKEPQV